MTKENPLDQLMVFGEVVTCEAGMDVLVREGRPRKLKKVAKAEMGAIGWPWAHALMSTVGCGRNGKGNKGSKAVEGRMEEVEGFSYLSLAKLHFFT